MDSLATVKLSRIHHNKEAFKVQPSQMTKMAELSSHLRQLNLIRSKFNERRESEQMSVWDTVSSVAVVHLEI